MRICSIQNCDRKHFCRGWCKLHYDRWKRLGDPSAPVMKMATRGDPMAWLRDNSGFTGDDCLTWPFARQPDGKAHMNGSIPSRVMCELVNGPPPSDSHQAAHSCGKAHLACISPRHLRWATPAENSADKEIHGTVIRGARHYGSKLNEEAVREIRALAVRMQQKEIAALFGVKPVCIHKIIHRKAWRHVA